MIDPRQQQKIKKDMADMAQTEYVPFERPIAEAVDVLMKLAKAAGYSPFVETEKHWEIVGLLFNLFVDLYPDQYKTFRKYQLRLQNDKKNSSAINKEGNAMMQHLLEIPAKFHDLIKAVFPQQSFDKEFSRKLAQRMPLLRVPD